MTQILAQPLFGIGLTLAAYAAAQWLQRRSGSAWANPVALSIGAIILLLSLGHIPYQSYAVGGKMILFLLGPSVVALGLPLYSRRKEILARRWPILFGVLAGSFVSVVSAAGLAWLCGGSDAVVRSLAPKSVTTPIAIGITEKLGGIPELTAALVVLTGCLGALCGPEFCRLIGIRSLSAMGLAVGTAAHGIGTARMLSVDRLGGAIAGLSIGLTGLTSAFLIPLLFVALG